MDCSKISVSRKCLMLVADWLLRNWNKDMVLEGGTRADQDGCTVEKLIMKLYILYKYFLHLFTILYVSFCVRTNMCTCMTHISRLEEKTWRSQLFSYIGKVPLLNSGGQICWQGSSATEKHL